MHKIVAAPFVVVFALLFVACGGGATAGKDADPCVSDSDCVPLASCHATRCGAPSHAEAAGAICIEDCQPGTLDCGGSCFCDSGHCAAQLN